MKACILLITLLLTACQAVAIERAALAAPTAPINAALESTHDTKSPNSSATDRAIIYHAIIALVVPDIRATQSTILQLATSHAGYLQELAGSSITIRVPAAKFQSTLDAIEHLGELTDRHIEASDVTEEMHDLHIRLDNALHVRDRLTILIDKSAKMEDTIKLEAELARVTETIETLKGKIQFMDSQIAMATIRVDLNSPRPQLDTTTALPFPWVRELGNGVLSGNTAESPDTSRFWKRNDRFQLPPSFVRYYERDHVTEAMSADEVIIRLRREDNYDGGDLGFWSKLIRRTLTDTRAVAITAETDLTLTDGTPARILTGTRDLGPHKTTYLVGIAATKRYVYTFEAWGDELKVQPQLQPLQKAFATLDAKHW